MPDGPCAQGPLTEMKHKKMKDKTSKQIHVGTSGWHYNHWKTVFYPETIPSSDWLSYYAGQFATVEINNSFYQMPEKETLEHWREIAPADFVFSVKASRYITHMKKLKDPREPVNRFMTSIESLGKKLGPVLFQLPPKWQCNADRLASFLSILPSGNRYALEFRDESWFNQRVYHILEAHNAAFCIYHLDNMTSPRKVTADFAYIRLHGPARPYQGSYDPQTLAGWVGAMTSWADQGRKIYCYFDNDQQGYAAQNALLMKNMMDN